MFFFFIVISIFFGLPGLIFFTLGLIHKKPGQWITGIVLTVIALIILIYSIISLINKSVNFISKISTDEFKYSYNHHDRNSEGNTYYDSLEKSKQITEENSDDKGVSGFIKGIDNKLTLIHVKINSQLELKGIVINVIADYTPQSIKKNGIPLKLNFSEDFKGKIKLTVYSNNNNEISSSAINCSAKKGDKQSVEFDFDKTIGLSDISYCMLSESDQ